MKEGENVDVFDDINIKYEDVLDILARDYCKIFRIDLSNNLYSIVSSSQKTETDDPINRQFTFLIKNYVDNGNVFEADIKGFKRITDIGELRKHFYNNDKVISYRYREKFDDEYRWVKMEISRSVDYNESNQIVLLSIKDMYGYSMERVEENIALSTNAIGICYVDITANELRWGSGDYYTISDAMHCDTVDEFIKNIAENISIEEQRAMFYDTFSVNNLLNLFNEGVFEASLRHIFIIDDEEKCLANTIIKMSKEDLSGDILGTFYIMDISDDYIAKTLPGLLYEHEYESVGIIDPERKLILLEKSYDKYENSLAVNSVLDYDVSVDLVTETMVPYYERGTFTIQSDLSYIVEKLKESKEYQFYIHHIIETGEKRLKRYKYIYFSEQANLILATMEDITETSEHDIIVGGYNRLGFIRHTANILENNKDIDYSVIFFNIKGFKAINDIFGNDSGDDVIKHVYNEIIKSRLKPIVTARATADHFVCLVESKDIDYETLNELCRVLYVKGGKTVMVLQRCGIYNIHDKKMSVSKMCDRAQLAATYIENEYVKPYAFYERYMHDTYIDKNEILSVLDEAIANDEFKAYYQPIYDAKTKKIASAEALVRWIHPSRGVVSPGLFIPILEENGYISQIDLLIERNVKEFIQRRINCQKHIVPISINLSRMDFFDVDMMEKIRFDVEHAEDLKGLYRFEITESSYVSIAGNNMKMITDMRNLGAMILIDDFGSGYSSFNAITDYDFDIIKLDMEFVKKIGKNKKIDGVIDSLISMAHHMDAKVVAEGAETEEQVEFLVKHNCDYIQGYYFSRPVSEKEFELMLDKEKSS